MVLFNYLLLFQLLALYHAFDYQYLTQLVPLARAKEKLAGSGQRIDQFGLSSGISCRVDYLPRKN